ncbi:BspA family leucine-rich repeat surface protein [Niabella hibiscisoli]|uniref:BspA family leucine-rich repeat surface protein n=1 Tax=Niabella hibiscisoli TaxID=1825928 RepID=UPI001F113E66|nr:BspA family leucine-rich repeat surface protein [Niabella hibiscisoli]MCH5717868.1 BspA family leucine-rich repeat surface protein [Niabella hibiscisoli]
MQAQQPFVTVWQTDNPGTTGSSSIQVPATGEYTYTWERIGTPAASGSGSANGTITITFPSPGTYRLRMTPSGTTPLHTMKFPLGSSPTRDARKLLDIEQWGTAVWSTFEQSFQNCTNLTLTATDAPNLTNVTSMLGTFSNAPKLIGTGMPGWNVSQVTNMREMFRGDVVFNQPLNNWNVGNVTDMSGMFFQAAAFNQPLDNWDVGKVTSMVNLFYQATSFNQNINSWNVSNVTNMTSMFQLTNFNQPLNNWNVSKVTIMFSMFSANSSFNQPLNNWDVSNVINLSNMFSFASSFNQPLNNWDVSNVTHMQSMFANASSFNQPLNNWDVSNVSAIINMFMGATAFNQNLGTWNVASAISLGNLLNNSGVDCENYSRTLYGWANSSSTPSNITLGAIGRTYSADAASYRDILLSTKNWTITGDGPGTCSIVLPVNFGTIAASLHNGIISIKWETLSERNNDHFEIEGSVNGTTFAKIGEVKSLSNAGISDKMLEYKIDITTVGWSAGFMVLLLMSGFAIKNRRSKRQWVLASLTIMVMVIAACSKKMITI